MEASGDSLAETLARVIQAQGRLLRVEWVPLARVEARGAEGVRARFRGDRDKPRWFAVFPRNGGIEVSVDT